MSEQLELEVPNLPCGWCWSFTELVCDGVDSGATPRKEYFVKRGEGVPFIKVYNLTFGGPLNFTKKPTFIDDTYHKNKMSRSTVQPGDVLMNIVGPPLGKVSLVTNEYPEWNINQAVAVFRAARYSNRLLAFYLSSAECQNWLSRTAKTTTSQVNLSISTCRRIPLPTPPQQEQEAIADQVETYFTKIDAAIANLKRVQANLKRYRASVLKAAVEGRLVPTEAELARQEGRDYEPASVLLTRILAERRRRWEQAELAKMKAKGKTPKNDKWKAKYKEPAKPDTKGLPELPEGWCWASLEQVTCGRRVICYGILMPKENLPGGVPYVKVRDMKNGHLDIKKLPRTSPNIAAKYTRSSLVAGDVLLAIRGTYGRVVHVPPELEGGNITQDSARLSFLPGIAPTFMAQCLKSPLLQKYFRRVARGVAVKGVNIKDVRLAPIPVPPSSEQTRIEVVVEGFESSAKHGLATVASSMTRCQRLRQSTLKWAFEGKLVDQDPNDEPASVLLDRIRSEREEAAKTAKKKPVRKRKKKAST